ncbi:MAG: VOC family protein [Anaerolineaceae bacterium]
MELAHIALYVQDLERVKDFYTRFFGAVANQKYHNPKTGLQTYFLSFESGARIELMTRPDLAPSEKSLCTTGYTHIAFRLGSPEKVDALTETLKAAGCHLLSGPRTTGDGYYESVLLDPENNQLELVA